MTRDELFLDIMTVCPSTDDVVYIGRRGEDYAWSCAKLGTCMPERTSGSGVFPDSWIYYSGRWPSKNDDINRWREFLDDLLAEMESMSGGADRCRWPLDDPWPHGH